MRMSDWSSDVCSSDLKQRTQRLVSLGGLLSFHVYAGAIGALLGIIHSGHKFQSPIGIALVIAMLTVVVTGFIGRYYLAQEIGRASCRESVCKYVSISVVAVSLKKKKTKDKY